MSHFTRFFHLLRICKLPGLALEWVSVDTRQRKAPTAGVACLKLPIQTRPQSHCSKPQWAWGVPRHGARPELAVLFSSFTGRIMINLIERISRSIFQENPDRSRAIRQCHTRFNPINSHSWWLSEPIHYVAGSCQKNICWVRKCGPDETLLLPGSNHYRISGRLCVILNLAAEPYNQNWQQLNLTKYQTPG